MSPEAFSLLMLSREASSLIIEAMMLVGRERFIFDEREMLVVVIFVYVFVLLYHSMKQVAVSMYGTIIAT